MTDSEVMKQALEALQCSLPFHETVQRLGAHNKAITALHAALEQPEQEPVAYCYVKKGSSADALTFDQKPADAVSGTVFPLYITPPQRKPLTDAEIAAIVREAAKGSAIKRDGSTSERIARAVEAKLKEKKYENNA